MPRGCRGASCSRTARGCMRRVGSTGSPASPTADPSTSLRCARTWRGEGGCPRIEHVCEKGLVLVRTRALLSYTCSIERLIERTSEALSAVACRHRSDKEPTVGQGDRHFP